MNAICQEIVFRGEVQGVGFRAVARRIAREHAVGGWVRNEPDRSVRCRIHGHRREVEQVLGRIRRELDRCIHDVTIEDHQSTDDRLDFEIRR